MSERVFCGSQLKYRGAAKGLFTATLTRKANAQTASLFGWSAVHGFTMLAISDPTNVEEIPIERLTDKILTMILGGMLGKKPARAG